MATLNIWFVILGARLKEQLGSVKSRKRGHHDRVDPSRSVSQQRKSDHALEIPKTLSVERRLLK